MKVFLNHLVVFILFGTIPLLAWKLVAKYSDGYVNEPGKMAQEVGYTKEWYDKSEWKNGPTKYPEPKVVHPGD